MPKIRTLPRRGLVVADQRAQVWDRSLLSVENRIKNPTGNPAGGNIAEWWGWLNSPVQFGGPGAGKDGGDCFKLTATNPGNVNLTYRQSGGFTPADVGKTLVLRVSGKMLVGPAPGRQIALDYAWETDIGTRIGSYTALVRKTFPDNTSWLDLSAVITVPAGAERLYYVTGATGGVQPGEEYLFDHALVAVVDTTGPVGPDDVPYFDGSTVDDDFTYAWTGVPYDSWSTRTPAGG